METTNDNIQVGEVIRDKRKSKGYTLRQLEGLSGISYSHLSKIERGELRPSRDTLKAIAKAFDEDPEPLLLLAGYAIDEIKNAVFVAVNPGKEKKPSHPKNYLPMLTQDEMNKMVTNPPFGHRLSLDTYVLKSLSSKSLKDSLMNIVLKKKELTEQEMKLWEKWNKVIEVFEKNKWEPDEVLERVKYPDQLVDELMQWLDKLVKPKTKK